MKFTPEQLEPVLNGTKVVQDLLIKHERWSVLHSLVFEHDGKLYQTVYQAPATEGQSCDPWGYQQEIECIEVFPVHRTVVVYEEQPVKPDSKPQLCTECGWPPGIHRMGCSLHKPGDQWRRFDYEPVCAICDNPLTKREHRPDYQPERFDTGRPLHLLARDLLRRIECRNSIRFGPESYADVEQLLRQVAGLWRQSDE